MLQYCNHLNYSVGASRLFSAVASNLTFLTLDDKLAIVNGISSKIEGSKSISFVHGQLGKPGHVNLLNSLYVPSAANISGGNFLRLMSVRLAIKTRYKFIFSKDLHSPEHDNGTRIDLVRKGGLRWLPNHFLSTHNRRLSYTRPDLPSFRTPS